MRQYIAELIGTFGLVFAGTGAIIINDISHGAISHVGIALTFGLIVMAMIYALGDISGAHINPAVTIAFYIANRISGKDAINYIIFQIMGAILASVFLKLTFPTHSTLGATLPTIAPLSAFMFEILLTFFLMLVIIQISKEKALLAGIVIGGTVGLEAMFAGPVTGASMNPARSLAPAIVSGNLEYSWIYIFAPIIGASLAIFIGRYLNQNQ